MSDLKDFAKDVGYFAVGAAAVVLEVGAKGVKALVHKGRKTLEDNQETVDELKRKAKQAGERIRDAVEKASQPEEAPVEDIPEEEGPVDPDAIPRTDEPDPAEEPAAPVEAPAEPAEAPVPEEEPAEEPKPDDSVNG